MILPPSLLSSLESTGGFDRVAFEAVHADPLPITSVRLNPLKTAALIEAIGELRPAHSISTGLFNMPVTAVPWSRYGLYLDHRPSFTFDPLFHAGLYYVQEASSMFLEQAFLQGLQQTGKNDTPIRVLDLSAAPGGKSTHLQSLLSKDSLLVSNEVIRPRANILKDNLIKWGSSNVVVTHNDPADFNRLENYFDVLVIDAPCSGSGLFRREPDAMDHWSENNVELCAQRQQRILADSYPSLKQGGLLIYSTCSYSPKEDEQILDWVIDTFSAEPLELVIGDDGITPVKSNKNGFGYRFWPDKIKGEGFFLAAFRKTDGEPDFALRARNKAEPVTRKEAGVVDRWVKPGEFDFIKHEQTVYAWPSANADDFSLLLNKMRVIYSGTIAGELKHDKLVPDHALALSLIAQESINKWELEHDQAILYLQRKDLPVMPHQKGWQLVTYRHHPLGWINALPNRINNYYPKEFRILRENE